jgi:hypothetical protein
MVSLSMVSRRLDNSLNQTLVILFQPQRGVNQIVGFRRFINRPFDCSSPENSYLFQRTNSVPSGPYVFSESAVICRIASDWAELAKSLSDEINVFSRRRSLTQDGSSYARKGFAIAGPKTAVLCRHYDNTVWPVTVE